MAQILLIAFQKDREVYPLSIDTLSHVSTLIPVHASEHVLGGRVRVSGHCVFACEPGDVQRAEGVLGGHGAGHVPRPVRAYAVAVRTRDRVGRDPGLDAGMVHAVPPPGGGVSAFAQPG